MALLLPAGSLSPATHILGLRRWLNWRRIRLNAAFDDTLLALRLTDSLRQVPMPSRTIQGQMLMLYLQTVWEGLARQRSMSSSLRRCKNASPPWTCLPTFMWLRVARPLC